MNSFITPQNLPGYAEDRTVSPKDIQAQAGKGREIAFPVTLDKDASYDGARGTGYEKYIRGGCFLAYSSSLWAPCKRTKANGSGSSSTSLTVDNATHFKAGDSIIIGYQTAQAIVSINYSTNVVTLTSSASWKDNDPVYVAAWGTARGILLDDEVVLWNAYKTAAAAKTAQMLVGGYVKHAQLLGDVAAILEDPLSAYYLDQIIFDKFQDGTGTTVTPAGNNLATPWKQVFLAADKTVAASDSGTEFIATAAVAITLPALVDAGAGFRIRAIQTADANLAITAPSGKLIGDGSATSTTATCSTSSHKIGSALEVTILPDFTKYQVFNLGGTTITLS